MCPTFLYVTFQGFVADLTGTGFYFNQSNTMGLSTGAGAQLTYQSISTDGLIASGRKTLVDKSERMCSVP